MKPLPCFQFINVSLLTLALGACQPDDARQAPQTPNKQSYAMIAAHGNVSSGESPRRQRPLPAAHRYEYPGPFYEHQGNTNRFTDRVEIYHGTTSEAANAIMALDPPTVRGHVATHLSGGGQARAFFGSFEDARTTAIGRTRQQQRASPQNQLRPVVVAGVLTPRSAMRAFRDTDMPFRGRGDFQTYVVVPEDAHLEHARLIHIGDSENPPP